MRPAKNDDLVKSRHSRAGGNPESAKVLKRLDSRFRGNDQKVYFQTFYGFIKNGRAPLIVDIQKCADLHGRLSLRTEGSNLILLENERDCYVATLLAMTALGKLPKTSIIND